MTGITPNIDFSDMPGFVVGAIPQGSTRTGTEVVYNISKKSTLVITGVSIVGPNASDFSVPASEILLALTNILPGNKSAADVLHVNFTPSGEGVRTAALQVSSLLGTVQVTLTGVGLTNQPSIGASNFTPLNFLPGEASSNIALQNSGGGTLTLNSVSIGGTNPEAFQLSVTNNGFGNCFPGVLLAPKSFCFIGLGLAPDAVGPASATLIIDSSDPVTPEAVIPLTLSAP
ncbi:MAG TPA: choice-of-anchor D domain-containing protein [Myxococcales bacterium]|nr:choice-of-anchor D domain-containing protein [Myxococcales bacterium]